MDIEDLTIQGKATHGKPAEESANVEILAGKKSRAASIAGWCLIALFVGLCGHYVITHWEDFSFVCKASLPETVAAAFLVLLSYLVNSFQLDLFLRKFSVSLRPTELVALTMAMLLGNLVIPMRGGTGGLAVYLRKYHGLDFQAFAVIYAGTALLVALINSALALISLLILSWFYGFVPPLLNLCVAAVFASCLYLGVFPPPMRWEGNRFLGSIFRMAHSWHLLTRDRRLLAWATGSLFIVSLILMGAFYLIYSSLGAPLSLCGTMVTSSLGNIANLIPLTPGSLGIFDAVVIQIPQVFGMDTAISIAAALVFRILCFFWAFLFGLPGMLYLFRNGDH